MTEKRSGDRENTGAWLEALEGAPSLELETGAEGVRTASLRIGHLERLEGVSLSWRSGRPAPEGGDRVLFLATPASESTLATTVEAAPTETPLLRFVAVRAEAEPPEDLEPVGELTLAGGRWSVFRLPPAPRKVPEDARRRLAATADRRGGEQPGHLGGRERWFKRRHGDGGEE